MLLLPKLKGHRSNFHYSEPQKAQLVDPEFKIQVTRGVQNIQVCIRTPCNDLASYIIPNSTKQLHEHSKQFFSYYLSQMSITTS